MMPSMIVHFKYFLLLNMNPAVRKLQEYINELQKMNSFSDIKEKANHLGLINQVDTAIKQIELCEKYGIVGGSKAFQLPGTGNPNFDNFVIAWDCESHHPANWQEVKFDGRSIRFQEGDVVIQK